MKINSTQNMSEYVYKALNNQLDNELKREGDSDIEDIISRNNLAYKSSIDIITEEEKQLRIIILE